MKKLRTIFLLIVMFALLFAPFKQAGAQHISLSPFVGYETGAKTHTSLGNLHAGDGLDFGGILDVGLGGGRFGEFSFSHLGTNLYLENGFTNDHLCDLAIDYYSLGVMQEIRPDSKVTPFGLFSVGIVNYRPTTTDISSENKMHVSIAGGIKVNVTEKLGLRLQARLLMPVYYSGAYFSGGTGGLGYGITGGVRALQGDFTTALVIKLR